MNYLNSTRVGLILNYSVFLYDIMKDYKNAYILANDVYQKTNKFLNNDNYDSSLVKELNKILDKLKENIGKWADTVVPEKVENIASDVQLENVEASPS